jgi:hypothetical protein
MGLDGAGVQIRLLSRKDNGGRNTSGEPRDPAAPSKIISMDRLFPSGRTIQTIQTIQISNSFDENLFYPPWSKTPLNVLHPIVLADLDGLDGADTKRPPVQPPWFLGGVPFFSALNFAPHSTPTSPSTISPIYDPRSAVRTPFREDCPGLPCFRKRRSGDVILNRFPAA